MIYVKKLQILCSLHRRLLRIFQIKKSKRQPCTDRFDLIPSASWYYGNGLKSKLYLKVVQFYAFFRVKKIPKIAPIRIIGANLINSHSNA